VFDLSVINKVIKKKKEFIRLLKSEKLTNFYNYYDSFEKTVDDLFLIREDLATEEIINKPWIEIQPKSNKVIYNGHVGNIGVPQYYFDKNKFSEY
jgi:hypothetical protein